MFDDARSRQLFCFNLSYSFFRLRLCRMPRQVLVNAVTGQVDTRNQATHFAIEAVPESLRHGGK